MVWDWNTSWYFYSQAVNIPRPSATGSVIVWHLLKTGDQGELTSSGKYKSTYIYVQPTYLEIMVVVHIHNIIELNRNGWVVTIMKNMAILILPWWYWWMWWNIGLVEVIPHWLHSWWNFSYQAEWFRSLHLDYVIKLDSDLQVACNFSILP